MEKIPLTDGDVQQPHQARASELDGDDDDDTQASYDAPAELDSSHHARAEALSGRATTRRAGDRGSNISPKNLVGALLSLLQQHAQSTQDTQGEHQGESYGSAARRSRDSGEPQLLDHREERWADELLADRMHLTSDVGRYVARAPEALELFVAHTNWGVEAKSALVRCMQLTTIMLADASERGDDGGGETQVACLRALARSLFTVAYREAKDGVCQPEFWHRVTEVGGGELVRELTNDDNSSLVERATARARAQAALYRSPDSRHAFRGRGYNKPHQKARQGDRRPAQPNHRSRSPRGQSPRGRPGGTAAAAARRAAGGAGAP